MELNFTVNCMLDIPNQAYTATVQSVVTPHEEDITQHFLSYCRVNKFDITTEEQIRTAILAYGKKYYQ